MSDWLPIKYMGFYDVPRIFITRYRSETYLFDCPFDEELEDDSDSYNVYVVPPLWDENLPKDWTTLHKRASRCLGQVLVESVRFDPSKRQSIDAAILEDLLTRKVAS